MVASSNSPEIVSKFKRDCELDNKWHETLNALETGVNIDNIIAVVDNPNGDVATKIGKDKAKAFKMKLETEYFDKKYDKKALKALNTEIDKVVHPELYCTVEESKYATSASKVAGLINDLADKYPLQVTVLPCTTDAKLLDAGKYISDKAGQNKMFAIVAMFELPKELVPDESD